MTRILTKTSCGQETFIWFTFEILVLPWDQFYIAARQTKLLSRKDLANIFADRFFNQFDFVFNLRSLLLTSYCTAERRQSTGILLKTSM